MDETKVLPPEFHRFRCGIFKETANISHIFKKVAGGGELDLRVGNLFRNLRSCNFPVWEMFFDYFLISEIFLSWISALGERRILIITGHIRPQIPINKICTVVKCKIGTAMEHVKIN